MTEIVRVVQPPTTPVVQVTVEDPRVVRAVTPAEPLIVQATVPGPSGPPGPPGPVAGEEDLPNLVLLFNNGLV